MSSELALILRASDTVVVGEYIYDMTIVVISFYINRLKYENIVKSRKCSFTEPKFPIYKKAQFSLATRL